MFQEVPVYNEFVIICFSYFFYSHTLNSSVSIDMIYLDFAEAFDKVEHNILLHNAKALGIQGKLGTWIHSFLSNRTHHVRLPGGWSTCSGVPQGTVLGPVLFLILMSDITEGINCNIVSFAGDTRLYSAINSITDCDDLQADLENFITRILMYMLDRIIT